MSVSRENFAAYADQQAAAPAGAPQWNAQQPQGPRLQRLDVFLGRGSGLAEKAVQ